jgi:very-short-patch-repair endonuclease
MTEEFDKFLEKYTYKKAPVISAVIKINRYIPEARSLGESQIRTILEELGYRYGHEYHIEKSFEELGRLRFDFFVVPLRLLIEFDGQQHYEGGKYASSREEWVNGIRRDELKNEFCKNNSYSLLRIPYVYSRNYRKMKKLIEETRDKITIGEREHELDLYFKWKSGIITI